MTTRLLILILSFLFIISCSEKTREDNASIQILKDTVLNFKTSSQNIKVSFDSIGNIIYFSSKSDTNTQNIFLNSKGKIEQIQNLTKNKLENTMDFNSNGQLDEIMWWNLQGEEPASNQFIRFCKSPTRSPIIDQTSSSVPVVNGFYKKLRVGEIEKLRLSAISIFPSTFEIKNLIFDNNILEIETSKKDKSELLIKCNKPGTYRLIIEFEAVFHLENADFKSDAQGQFYKVDLELTFK